MTVPLVTVAVPVRNGERYVEEALDSVLAQEGVDLDVRVYDNRSTDRTLELLLPYLRDPRVSLAVNDRDVVYYGSLNRALVEARGEWFVPFAADDRMLPDNLRRKVEALKATGAGFVHGHAWIIDEHGNRTGRSDPLDHLPPVLDAPHFMREIAPVNPMVCQTAVVRTDALRALGGFDGRIQYCADWLAWMRLGLRYRVATIHEPLVEYRRHGQSGTSSLLSDGSAASQTPPTQDHVFDDPAMPGEWHAARANLVAERCWLTALDMDYVGLRRATDGNAAYVLAAKALALEPEPGRLERWAGLLEKAGLALPRVPFDLVVLPEDAAELSAALPEALALHAAGLVERLIVGVPPERLAVTEAALAPVLEGVPELDAHLVAADGLDELLVPGRAVLAAVRSPAAGRAEAAGIPIVAHSLPAPFARAPRADWYEVV